MRSWLMQTNRNSRTIKICIRTYRHPPKKDGDVAAVRPLNLDSVGFMDAPCVAERTDKWIDGGRQDGLTRGRSEKLY